MRRYRSLKDLARASVMSLIAVAGIHSAQAHGEDLTDSKKFGAFRTSSHLGYAVADNSSTGFNQVGGTFVLLDITHPVSYQFELGLRSIAEGGRTDSQEFYRMGAGPLVTYKLNRDWQLQGAWALFNETGLGPKQQNSYQSRGQEIQLGWERLWHFNRRVELAGGGFGAYHTGGVSPAAATHSTVLTGRSAHQANTPSHNSGFSHGFELALRLSL